MRAMAAKKLSKRTPTPSAPPSAAKPLTGPFRAEGEVKRGPGKPSVLTGAWGDLAQAAGGVVALADILGVSRRTILRWGLGKQQMNGAAEMGVRVVAVSLGVPSPV